MHLRLHPYEWRPFPPELPQHLWAVGVVANSDRKTVPVGERVAKEGLEVAEAVGPEHAGEVEGGLHAPFLRRLGLGGRGLYAAHAFHDGGVARREVIHVLRQRLAQLLQSGRVGQGQGGDVELFGGGLEGEAAGAEKGGRVDGGLQGRAVRARDAVAREEGFLELGAS